MAHLALPHVRYEELVESFTEVLTSRRVSEQMRQLMSALVSEILGARARRKGRLFGGAGP